MTYMKLKAKAKSNFLADGIVSAFGLFKDLTSETDTISTSSASLQYTGQTDAGAS